jgi:hypothetical protein
MLSKESKCWPEFYKYIRRHEGYRENIPAIKDSNGRLITDPIEKVDSLNYYYSSVFSSECNIQHIQCANSGVPLHVQCTNSGVPFTIDVKIITKKVAAIGKNKLIGPDGISGEIPKLGGEAMISYLVRLLDITMNNGTLPADWKRTIVVHVHKGPSEGPTKLYVTRSINSGSEQLQILGNNLTQRLKLG